MALRRSTRVQALPKAAPTLTSQLKVTKRKASTADSELSKSAAEAIPTINGRGPSTSATPAKRQTPRKRTKVEHDTATPADISAVKTESALPDSAVKMNGTVPLQDPLPRPADPHVANAPIKSPNSNKVVTAYSTWSSDIAGPAPTGTTNSILDDAVAHLKRMDENGRLTPYIEKFHCKVFDAEGLAQPIDPFRSLASGIISQQVSGAAASSIKKKFVGLFEASEAHNYAESPDFPPPALVAAMPIPTLRTAGLSQRKAEYIQGLAEHFDSGRLSAEMLAKASDEEVMEKLIAVRGLGKWSVEMFACFDLKRMNVFSTGDLGVQRGLAVYTGKDVNKLKAKGGGKWKYMGSEQAMLEAAEKFSPYRSLFMWYMWRLSDVDVSALEKMERTEAE
ncbi:3-methyladenine DNA glycosidase [Aureobasidium pullulans]|uniref:3-methyladenine DNA glycosidase n=1 Tax=Aureobasidium pullulans TaxID=5580 RepID=A0A4S9TPK2_AURPU|nr:3-methyladenine DNA glycosidase [Aureobasidium pullulans]